MSNEQAMNNLRELHVGLGVAISEPLPEPASIASSCIQCAMLVLIGLDKPLPPSLLAELGTHVEHERQIDGALV